VRSLSAVPAKDDKKVSASQGFQDLEEEDIDCAVALRWEGAGNVPGVWCFIEPSQARRDRLIEAVVILTTACGGG